MSVKQCQTGNGRLLSPLWSSQSVKLGLSNSDTMSISAPADHKTPAVDSIGTDATSAYGMARRISPEFQSQRVWPLMTDGLLYIMLTTGRALQCSPTALQFDEAICPCAAQTNTSALPAGNRRRQLTGMAMSHSTTPGVDEYLRFQLPWKLMYSTMRSKHNTLNFVGRKNMEDIDMTRR